MSTENPSSPILSLNLFLIRLLIKIKGIPLNIGKHYNHLMPVPLRKNTRLPCAGILRVPLSSVSAASLSSSSACRFSAINGDKAQAFPCFGLLYSFALPGCIWFGNTLCHKNSAPSISSSKEKFLASTDMSVLWMSLPPATILLYMPLRTGDGVTDISLYILPVM